MGMYWVAYHRDQLFAEAALADPELLDDLLESEDDAASVDIDKAWHGVHWLLTGSAEPSQGIASQVIFGGQPMGDDPEDSLGQLQDAPLVTAISAFLQTLSDDDLKARFNPADMERADIYPSGIWGEDRILEEYLLPAVARLKDFYAKAASSGDWVIACLG